MMTNQTLLFIICFFLSASTVQDRLSGACVGVADGDTITILTQDKRQHKIRLAHIDCPEKGNLTEPEPSNLPPISAFENR
jgi:endonuclease YncB( thermonuclease family)